MDFISSSSSIVSRCRPGCCPVLGSMLSRVVYYLAVIYCASLLVHTCTASPTRAHQPDSSRHNAARPADSLWAILRDLEDAVFRLKEYALSADLEASRREATETGDIDVPEAEISELDDRRMDESYPELVPGLGPELPADKKAIESLPDKTIAHPAAAAPAAAAAAAASSKDDDISLRDALEFLVNLAKQKKQEKRDHDIPFPVADSH